MSATVEPTLDEHHPPESNALGPIATSYDDLQSLPALFSVTRGGRPEVPGSVEQAVRALLQASELALVTITCSAEQAHRASDGHDGDLAERSLGWMVAFCRVWADIAWRIGDTETVAYGPDTRVSSVTDSANWRRHHAVCGRLSESYLRFREASSDRARTDRLMLQYTLLERAAIERTVVACGDLGYDEFVDAGALGEIVRDSPLPDDTVFIPFRSAHQISEVLVDGANDHLALAVATFDDADPVELLTLLHRVDRLLDATVGVAEMLADSLHHDDYHRIRENLGLTSDSHSVGLHYHLMRDLYPALAAAARRGPDPFVRSRVRAIGRHIDRWRAAHLGLPRMNLGGARGGTRSLTGAPDALHTVQRMRERGWAADALGGRLAPLSTDQAFEHCRRVLEIARGASAIGGGRRIQVEIRIIPFLPNCPSILVVDERDMQFTIPTRADDPNEDDFAKQGLMGILSVEDKARGSQVVLHFMELFTRLTRFSTAVIGTGSVPPAGSG